MQVLNENTGGKRDRGVSVNWAARHEDMRGSASTDHSRGGGGFLHFSTLIYINITL